MEIQYLKGDATSPQSEGNKIIVHICNDVGGWGKGFVLAISKKWASPEEEYREWHRQGECFKLGEVKFAQVEPDLWVANLIGQRDIRKKNGVPPIRYDSVNEGLAKVGEKAYEINASVHMPRIGCGLAGGKWEEIEPLIESNLLCNEVATFVYDFG